VKHRNRETTQKELYTRWGRELDPDCPLNDYPRPQLKRENWACLNGVWEFAFCDAGAPEPEYWDGEIVVPFSPESLLSGVGRQLQPGQTLWYRRKLHLDIIPAGTRLLLHFGAVDQCCAVFINGAEAGKHAGGYWPFCFDITGLIKEGDNELAVSVADDSDGGIQAYGKQKLKRGGIWYTAQSGIWQTVWAEYVPRQYIESVRITPRFRDSRVEFALEFAGEGTPPEYRIEVFAEGRTVSEGSFKGAEASLPLEGFRSWSPDDPFLYTVRITAGEDTVESYFGIREFGTVCDKNGHKRLALNGKPIFHSGLLDQGYWSDGLYTPPSDEAMAWEIKELKKLGFNMLRKHIKIEPLRWYYHCDRLGMLVWQDFVSGGGPYRPLVTQALPFAGVRLRDDRYGIFARKSEEGRKAFEADAARTLSLLYNAVCIAVWVPFNEGWGQFDARRIAGKVREADPTRLVDHASGWHDQKSGDFKSRHIYYRKFRMKPDPAGRIQVLSEFGGYSSPAEGHMASDTLFGYRMYRDFQALSAAYEKLYRSEVLPAVKNGLSAAVYTQVSDVEDEINGLFTYDRELMKVDAETVRRINAELIKEGG
jgi:hypothetical protein